MKPRQPRMSAECAREPEGANLSEERLRTTGALDRAIRGFEITIQVRFAYWRTFFMCAKRYRTTLFCKGEKLSWKNVYLPLNP